MPDKSEKERRRQTLDALQKKADEEFEQSLPISRDDFKLLFDYLDAELGNKGCDRTNNLTRVFLQGINTDDVDEALTWLADKGGYCDCEILANVEEQFE